MNFFAANYVFKVVPVASLISMPTNKNMQANRFLALKPYCSAKFSVALLATVSLATADLGLFAGSAVAQTPKPGSATRIARSPQKTAKSQTIARDSREGVAHLLNRVTYGIRPGDIEKVQQIGVKNYLSRQLAPHSIELPDSLVKVSQVPALTETPVELFLNFGKPALKALVQNKGKTETDKKALQKVIKETYGRLYGDAVHAHFVRAVESPRQLEEVMTDFWFNHFNVSSDKGLDHIWVGHYEEAAIRPYALGRFRDMLGATAHHAAMLFYLDNWQNTSASLAPVVNKNGKSRFKGINENYARELMELHTLGVDGGYTQKDVQELARVLTGLGLPAGAGGGMGVRNLQQRRAFMQNAQAPNGAGADAPVRRRRLQRGVRNFGAPITAQSIQGDAKSGSYFDPRRHDNGTKVVVGHTIAPGGEREIETVLDILARHPSTARHISYKLAQYFVADKPPDSLVQKMAATFTRSDGQIAQVMNTLFESDEFWNSQYCNKKFKSPHRYIVSSLRATEATISNAGALVAFLKQSGQPLYKCLTPDGYKNTQEAWLNPDSLINRLNFATALGANRLPGLKVNESNDLSESLATVSEKTVSAIEQAPPQLRQSLVLGSPEFMMY